MKRLRFVDLFKILFSEFVVLRIRHLQFPRFLHCLLEQLQLYVGCFKVLHCKEDTDDGNPDHRYRFEVVCEGNHLFFWKFCKRICSKHSRNCSTNTLNIAVKHCQHRCQAKTKGKIVKVTFHRQVVKQDRKSKTRKHTSCKSQAVCEPLIFCNKVNNRLDKSTTKGKSQEDWKGTRESPRNRTKR